MFSKKCSRCGKKAEKKFTFCPYCGNNMERERDEDDFGFLGKDDAIMPDFPKMNLGMPFGFDGIFDSLVKQVDKQLKSLDKELGRERKEEKEIKKIQGMPNVRSGGFSISIATATGKKPEIRIRGFGPEFQQLKGELELGDNMGKPERQTRIKKHEISEEKAREIAKLPREEAETKLKRLGNKVIYEIALPGVKKQEDIVVNKLENSIEIKAFAKDRVYFKLLPINLPIARYGLKNETLILELAGR